MPKFDVEDLVSATELTRNTASLLKRASEGSRLLVINKNTPIAALIGMEDLRRLDALDASNGGSPTRVPPAPRRPTFDDFRDALSQDTHDDRCNPDTTSLSVPIGMTPDAEVLWIDVADSRDVGPHTLVVGVTGAGATTVAQAIAWGLCARYSPERVNLVLAGRSHNSLLTWQALHKLPHVVHVTATDDIGADGKTRLDSFIDREIARRTAITAENAGHGDILLPRLVIIVDYIAPTALAELLDKADSAGPGIRIHLVVTDRSTPKRSVDRFAYRIALRMRSAADSRDLIGSAAAAMLSVPGRAIVVDDQDSLTELAIFDPYPKQGDAVEFADLKLSDFCATNSGPDGAATTTTG